MPKSSTAKKPAPAKKVARPKPKLPGKPAPTRRVIRHAGEPAGSPLQDAVAGVAMFLPHGRIFPSALNPRRHDDPAGLEPLAASIVQKSVIQPITVRPGAGREDDYEIVMGERRWRAAGIALADGRLPPDWRMPAILRPCSDRELVEFAVIENIGRQDMSPLDEAEAVRSLRQWYPNDQKIADLLGIPRRTLDRRVQLLRLAPPVRDALAAGKIPLQVAQTLALATPETQKEIWKRDGKKPAEIRLEQLRWDVRRGRVAMTLAAFDPALYDGELATDEGTGEAFALDIPRFRHFQGQALEAKAAELRKRLKWVEIADGKIFYWDYESCPAKDPDAGALLWLSQDHKLEVRSPVLKPDIAKARRAALEEGDAATSPAARKEAERAKAEAALVAQLRDALRRRPADLLALLLIGTVSQATEDAGAAFVEALPAGALADLHFELGTGEDLAKLERALDGLYDQAKAAKVFRVLRRLGEGALFQMAIAVEAAREAGNLVAYDGTIEPLGAIVLEPPLPLEQPKA